MNKRAWKVVSVLGIGIGASLFAATFYLLVARSEISDDSKYVFQLEQSIIKAEDLLRGIEVAVDDSVQPHLLESRTHGNLFKPVEGQVVRVRRDSVALNGKEDA